MRSLNLFAVCLALFVVVLGAYVRLSAAGLGCPDWPGCYGHVTPIQAHHEILAAQQIDPNGPVSPAKAWKEMVHRYFAGVLALSIFTLAILAWRAKPMEKKVLPTLLVGVIIFQALLGMWTVTMKNWPIVVSGHLMGGMATFALLFWLLIDKARHRQTWTGLRTKAALFLALVAIQIALGGWTSTNYAALVCPDLFTCQGQILPHMDWNEAFSISHGPGELPLSALVTIQIMHRIGALAVVAGAIWLVSGLLSEPGRRTTGWLLLLIVAIQVLLGIGNVLLSLPIPIAVAHNAGAAVLLAYAIWINMSLKRSQI